MDAESRAILAGRDAYTPRGHAHRHAIRDFFHHDHAGEPATAALVEEAALAFASCPRCDAPPRTDSHGSPTATFGRCRNERDEVVATHPGRLTVTRRALGVA